MMRLYAGVATYSYTTVSSRDICFIEASSQEEAERNMARVLYAKAFELYSRAELPVVFMREIPQKLINKHATPRPPSKTETVWAAIPDEQRGVGPDIPKVAE